MNRKLGETELYPEDAIVIVAYFIILMGVGIWSSVRSKKNSLSGYFLAGRNMPWILVGTSIFSSNIGSEHFIGLAGSGASSGITVAAFELTGMFVLLILGWIFVPVYMASGVYTMPEYLRKRYGGQRIRIYLSVLALLIYVLTKISADLYAGAIFINQALKLNLYVSVLSILAIAGFYTIAGGLTAVIWTDSLQTIIMVLGALYLSGACFYKLGGYHQLVENFKHVAINETFVGYNSFNESCSKVPNDYMHLLKSPMDPEYPGTGMTIGIIINSIWYWCSDQVIVQRALSARNLSHAKAGCILAGYLKSLPLFIMVFPGMASRIFFPNEIACSNPAKCKEICGSELGCSNIAYPKLVLELMPAGARGMMISVMLAALMSSLTSIFNSSSTIFTMDIWRRIRKEASEMELLIVGKLSVLILVAISIIWIPIVENAESSHLIHYIQSVISYLSPPVCAIYLLGILVTRVNEQGAFWGLMVGLLAGGSRFIWEFSYSVPSCASGLPDPTPYIISKVHYLHFGILLFLLTGVVAIIVSLLTQPIDKIHLYRLTFWSRHSENAPTGITKKQPPSIYPCAADLEIASVAFEDDDGKSNHANDERGKELKCDCDKESAFKGSTMTVGFERTTKICVWKKAFYFICGLSKQKANGSDEQQKNSPEEDAQHAAEIICEDPFWNSVCNVNAVLLLGISCFIWGYFA